MIVPGIIELEGKPEIGGCNDVDSQYIYIYIIYYMTNNRDKRIYMIYASITNNNLPMI